MAASRSSSSGTLERVSAAFPPVVAASPLQECGAVGKNDAKVDAVISQAFNPGDPQATFFSPALSKAATAREQANKAALKHGFRNGELGLIEALSSPNRDTAPLTTLLLDGKRFITGNDASMRKQRASQRLWLGYTSRPLRATYRAFFCAIPGTGRLGPCVGESKCRGAPPNPRPCGGRLGSHRLRLGQIAWPARGGEEAERGEAGGQRLV